jgi:hypothetical protein
MQVGKSEELREWTRKVIEKMPNLTKPQAVVLAMWTFGIVMTQSSGLGVQPGYAQIGTRCKVMLRQSLKTLDFTLFRYRIERVLSCENITKKGHLWASLRD